MNGIIRKPKILISIVAYKNSVELLQDAISSVLSAQADFAELKVCVVDNSPCDKLSVLKDFDPRVQYRFQNANLGYGAGHNHAIREFMAWSDYHLVLNPDMKFGPEVLPAIVKFMEETPRAGLCMPKILYPDGTFQKACRLLPTPSDLILRRFGVRTKALERANVIYEMQRADFNEVLHVPFISGCFMFFRTSILKAVDGFDERYFMYLEDTDISRRALDHGENYYLPHVHVYHEHQKGSHKDWRLLSVHMLSAVKYFNKWGWFFDRTRKQVNGQIIERYALKPPQN